MAGIDVLNSLQDRGIDFGSSISVTAAATLDASALGKVIVCSGTSADYTVGLPAASESKGKRIVMLMDAALTKLVTLDGNDSESIDGSATRIMWAGEVAELLSDGTQWLKISGKTIPFSGLMWANAINQLFNASAFTKILCNSFTGNALLNDVATNNAIRIARTGKYSVVAAAVYNNNNSTAGANYVVTYVDGVADSSSYAFAYRAASAHYGATSVFETTVTNGQLLTLVGFFLGGSFSTSSIQNDANKSTKLAINEIVQW